MAYKVRAQLGSIKVSEKEIYLALGLAGLVLTAVFMFSWVGPRISPYIPDWQWPTSTYMLTQYR